MRWHRNFGSVLSLLLLFVGCAAQKPALDAESLQMRYHQAILDAQVAEPKEISTNLTAITPTNNKLIWQTFDSTSYLAVVTWTSWNGYDDRVGESLVLQREVWVTVVPELRDFCQNIDTYSHWRRFASRAIAGAATPKWQNQIHRIVGEAGRFVSSCSRSGNQ